MTYFEPRIMRRIVNGVEMYAIYEVYISTNPDSLAYTQDALSNFALSVEDLKRNLKEILDNPPEEIRLGELMYKYDVEDVEWWLENAEKEILDYNDQDFLLNEPLKSEDEQIYSGSE